MFGEFMKEKRAAAGVSIYKLAKTTGISGQQLANYEAGTSSPTVEKADMVCRALGVKFTLGMKEGSEKA